MKARWELSRAPCTNLECAEQLPHKSSCVLTSLINSEYSLSDFGEKD
nr:MAG TPA: hypothetical protein [Caudoviricetes sp.]